MCVHPSGRELPSDARGVFESNLETFGQLCLGGNLVTCSHAPSAISLLNREAMRRSRGGVGLFNRAGACYIDRFKIYRLKPILVFFRG